MRRRDFIPLFGGAAAASLLRPLMARAQQPASRMRRISVLLGSTDGDPLTMAALAAFAKALQELGWTDGRNIRIERPFAAVDVGRMQAYAKELVGLQPDLIVAQSTPAAAALQRETRTIPIVFVNVSDPVASGLVASLARPGGNITGFTSSEYSLGGKWMNILKDIAPSISRVMLLYDPENPNWAGYLRTIEAAATASRVDVSAARVTAADEIVSQVGSFAREPGAGMIVQPAGLTNANRQLIADLAARHRLPAVYPYGFFARSGGLISYGPDFNEQYRGAAAYVDRILRGEKATDLPVQAPTKFELIVNLKAAMALGLTVPPSLQFLADEVIE